MTNERNSFHDEDVEMVVAWRRGDFAALETLVRKHQKRLLNLAFRLTGNYDQACLIVQETFVAASRDLDSMLRAPRFATWLTGIAVARSRERLRQQPPPRHRDSSSRNKPAGPAGIAAIEESSQPVAATGSTERPPRHEQLQECLAVLSPELREAIVLRDVQEASYEEISSILKVRHDMVALRLSQARKVFKDCLREAVGGV